MQLTDFIDKVTEINDEIVAGNIILIKCESKEDRDALLAKLVADVDDHKKLEDSPLVLIGKTLNRYVAD